MTNWSCVVTGASSGVGKALTEILLEQGCHVLGVARRDLPMSHERLQSCSRDLSRVDEIEAFATGELDEFLNQALQRGDSFALINNAGTLNPVGKTGQAQSSQLQAALTLNTIAPMRFSAVVAARSDLAFRVIANISSGAAHKPYPGWGSYCVSKAALRMASRCLATDAENDPTLRVIEYEPGVVDTPMQDQVRGSDPKDFPNVERFLNLYREGKLVAPRDTSMGLWKLIQKRESLDVLTETRFG